VAAVFLIVRWQAVWDFAGGIFGMGTFVLAILLACLMLMMGLLMCLRLLRQLLGG
jgi:hypothetical protein